MIPARMGSKRVHKKNLRLLNGKPLICYIIEAAIASGVFEKRDIYINSEDLIFKEIANHYGINFYHRPAHLAIDEATNDDFAYDFIQNLPSDYLLQLLPTSPFITPQNIKDVYWILCKIDPYGIKSPETLISVNKIQIECTTTKAPINYVRTEKTKPSQTLDPIYAYSCGIMAWETQKFKQNIKQYGAAYHGAQSNTNMYPLQGYSTIDIDTEEDFALAECIAKTIAENKKQEPQYYTPAYFNKGPHTEISVPEILENDGIEIFKTQTAQAKSVFSIENISEIIMHNLRSHINQSWAQCLIDNDSNSATLICQYNGQGNRMHHHPNWNEWWLIIKGRWQFIIDGNVREASEGDLIFIPKGIKHKITAIDDGPNVRLAVSRYDIEHVYDEENKEVRAKIQEQ